MQNLVVIAKNKELKISLKLFCEKYGFFIAKTFKSIQDFLQQKQQYDIILVEYSQDENFECLLKMCQKSKIAVFASGNLRDAFKQRINTKLFLNGNFCLLLEFLCGQTYVCVERKTGRVVDLEKRISTFCLEAGILPHLSGYRYVVEAIVSTMLDMDNMRYLTKQVYPKVAQKFHVTSSIVERTIRHALIVAGQTGKLSKINELISAQVFEPNERVSNGQFISLVADRFLFNLKILNSKDDFYGV